MNSRQKRHIFEVLPLFLIGAGLVLIIVLASVSSGQTQERLTKMTAGWTVSGTEFETLPDSDSHEIGKVTHLTTTLNEDFRKTRAICFYSMYAEVRVYLDDELLYCFLNPDNSYGISAAPSIWNKIIIPGGATGSTLTIEMCSPYAEYTNRIPSIYHGSVSDIEHYIFMNTMPRFVAALAILLIGLVFSIIAIILRYHRLAGNNGLYSLTLFIVVLAIFLASQQTSILMDMYSGTSYIFIQYVAFMLCPIMYTRYMMREYKGVRRRIARILNIVSIVSCIILTLLHFLNVWELPETTTFTRILCFAVIVYALVIELSQHNKRIVLFVLGGLLLYALIEYYVTATFAWPVYLGMFIYIYVLIYRIVSTLMKARMTEIRLESALEVSKSEIATIQITSHFFYHTLDSIRALIRIDADRAYKMTGDFAKYIRYRVDGVEKMQEKVPFSREVRSIRAYTDIKQAQLGDRFTMEYDIETEDFEILPLTVQPLVENSVIHAVQRRRTGGIVRIVCREMHSGYFIEVIDNGPGENADPEPRLDEKRSTAIRNINTRLAYYGISPINYEDNELGGKTAQVTYPKKIARKERFTDASNFGG